MPAALAAMDVLSRVAVSDGPGRRTTAAMGRLAARGARRGLKGWEKPRITRGSTSARSRELVALSGSGDQARPAGSWRLHRACGAGIPRRAAPVGGARRYAAGTLISVSCARDSGCGIGGHAGKEGIHPAPYRQRRRYHSVKRRCPLRARSDGPGPELKNRSRCSSGSGHRSGGLPHAVTKKSCHIQRTEHSIRLKELRVPARGTWSCVPSGKPRDNPSTKNGDSPWTSTPRCPLRGGAPGWRCPWWWVRCWGRELKGPPPRPRTARRSSGSTRSVTRRSGRTRCACTR